MNESNHKSTVPASNMEQNTGNEPVAEEKAEGFNTLVNIRVISYRKFKHDPDGISCKAVLDGIVQRGILRDDSTKEINKITYQSVKSDEERTVIEIEDCLDEQDNQISKR